MSNTSKMYLVNLDIEKVAQLKEKAWQGKKLTVAVWVDDDAQEAWKKCTISYRESKESKNTVYLGNAWDKKPDDDDGIPF